MVAVKDQNYSGGGGGGGGGVQGSKEPPQTKKGTLYMWTKLKVVDL